MFNISAVDSSFLHNSIMAGCSLNVTDCERLVNRLKNTNFEKFSSLVQMHLSFLLDLSGSSLEEFICQDRIITSTAESSVSKFFSFGKRRCHKDKENKPSGIIFGQPLCEEAISALYPLMEFLKQSQCLSEEGLFRKSGQAVRQRNLQDSLDTSQRVLEQIEDDLHKGVYTAHDCASIIKMYLRELPEPLLTTKHYIAYCQIPGMTCQRKQLQTMQLLVQLLPQENFILLQLLLELLHQVSVEPKNKMTADSLATLLAPHFLIPRTTNAYDLQAESCNVIQVMSLMIQYHEELFHYPENLIRDIRLYWDEMEGVADLNKTCGMSSDDELDCYSYPKIKKRVDPVDDAINTTVYFADRAASNTSSDFTHKQIAELYAYVNLMPDSPKKRKLVKQFNKHASTPVLSSDMKHKHVTSSLGDSIKKVISKTPKRKNSYDLAQLDNHQQPESCYTPIDKNYDGATPKRCRESSNSFRRQVQASLQVNCRKLSMVSSQSSLSSSESCDTCSVHSAHSIESVISKTSSTDSTNSIPTLPSPVNNNNSAELLDKTMTTPLCGSQMMNVFKTPGLPEHMCMNNIDGDKENALINVSPPVLFSTPAFCKSVLTRDRAKDCNCLCDVSKSLSSQKRKTVSPVSVNSTPTCIRA